MSWRTIVISECAKLDYQMGFLVVRRSDTSLMIKHNVGVSTEHVYEVKKIDSDFFMDEL